MNIVLTGVSTSNKGAELMLYAILQEIEHKHPKSRVYLDMECLGTHKLTSIKTSINVAYKPHYFMMRVCRKLKLNKFVDYLRSRPVTGMDYYLDCSGFYFSDQMDITDKEVKYWSNLIAFYKKQGVKIVFLPQAFGPLEKSNTQKLINIIRNDADLVYVRDNVSYGYLKDLGFAKEKLKLSTDFTSLVSGKIPQRFSHLMGAVCIIPNNRMIQQNKISLDDYISMMISIVKVSKVHGKQVYLLLHAEGRDYDLAKLCQSKYGGNIEIVGGLNALEVKGMISSSYLCVSSRYHGVASALNSCVPCLATSWSHKYKELFNDYNMDKCILPLDDKDCMLSMVTDYLQIEKNSNIREKLKFEKHRIQQQTKVMWEEIWSL